MPADEAGLLLLEHRHGGVWIEKGVNAGFGVFRGLVVLGFEGRLGVLSGGGRVLAVGFRVRFEVLDLVVLRHGGSALLAGFAFRLRSIGATRGRGLAFALRVYEHYGLLGELLALQNVALILEVLDPLGFLLLQRR